MRILSVDGGGYLGLATAALLDVTEREFGSSAAERFDLFCGTSTGAIIALGLAAGKSAAEVARHYEEMGPKIFPPANVLARHIPATVRRILWRGYDNEPLRAALASVFGSLTLGDIRDSGKQVLVTSFCLTTGRPRIFKTDHGDRLKAHDRYLLRDVALASAAAPTYLPIVELSDPVTGAKERFIDGGVLANSPGLLGYAEAVSHLRTSPRDISLLSLSTPRTNHAEFASARTRSRDPLRRSIVGWGSLPGVLLDGPAMVSDTALKLIMEAAGGRYERTRLEKPEGLGLDTVTEKATETLRQLGVDCARESATRDMMAHFFKVQ